MSLSLSGEKKTLTGAAVTGAIFVGVDYAVYNSRYNLPMKFAASTGCDFVSQNIDQMVLKPIIGDKLEDKYSIPLASGLAFSALNYVYPVSEKTMMYNMLQQTGSSALSNMYVAPMVTGWMG